MSLEPDKLDFLVGRMLSELAACSMGPLVRIGDALGLYKAMAGAGPLTPSELAERTGCAERYLREWLSAHAAAEYVACDPQAGTFELTPEQALIFADETSPVCMLGAYELFEANMRDHGKIAAAFKTGAGVGWHEHHQCLFSGVERFFRPGYMAHLIAEWLPAVDGAVDKLTRGAKVADVGCGHGASTILMAEAFPNSIFYGFDNHAESIERAQAVAREKGLTNVRFEAFGAKTFPGGGYDLICFFDALHDMGDPVGAARHAAGALAADGAVMLVEPMAGDTLAENLNPVGRIYYAGSTMICTPGSLAQEVGLALGAQAGQRRLSAVLAEGGLPNVRRAAATPFNMILEARA